MGRLDDPDYYYKKRRYKYRKVIKEEIELPRYIMQYGVLYERKDATKPKDAKVDDTIKIVENIMVSFK